MGAHVKDLLIFFGAMGVLGFTIMFVVELYLSAKSKKEIKKMFDDRDQHLNSVLRDLNALRKKSDNDGSSANL